MISTVLKRIPGFTALTRIYLFVNGKVIVRTMQTYVGAQLRFHLLLILVLDRDEWLATHSGRFIPWECIPGAH
jgi:hypothetical protein